MAAIFLAASVQCISAQPLSGTYTCANGNPGGSFDYSDIGDFFDDIENQGVGGSLVLDVYDDGGAFTSKTSYGLGWHAVIGQPFYTIPVAGLSSTSTLTLRAPAGENPVIAGPAGIGGAGLSFGNIGYTTIEGLTFSGGVHYGIIFERLP
jgi:hypothetical protein